MRLSVVIPCYNGAETLAVQLEALRKQNWGGSWEVILADNGSTDDSVDIAREYQKKWGKLKIVDASAKKGQPYALNFGAMAANGRSLAFCDADDEVAPGWLEAMGNALEKYEFVAGSFELKKLNPAGLMTKHPQEQGLNRLRYPPFLPHAGSGNMGIRKSVLKFFGGFDETVPYLFDTEFCFRVQLAGYNLHFVPDAVLHMRRPENLIDFFRKAQNFGKYHVLLYKRFRFSGMAVISWKTGVKAWINQLLLQPLKIRTRNDIARFLWNLGWRIGWVKGCFQFRILVP